MPRLTGLHIVGATDRNELRDLSSVTRLLFLEELVLSGCAELTDIRPLSGLTQLTELDLRKCKALADISPLARVTTLRKLMLSGCKALAVYDRSLEVDPQDPKAWAKSGKQLSLAGRREEAIACCDRALQLDPGDEAAWRCKGVALYKLARYDESILCCDEALELHPRADVILVIKGVGLGTVGRTEEAIACFDQALAIDPRYTFAWIEKGGCLERLGWLRKAMVCFHTARRHPGAVRWRRRASWARAGHAPGISGPEHDHRAARDRRRLAGRCQSVEGGAAAAVSGSRQRGGAHGDPARQPPRPHVRIVPDSRAGTAAVLGSGLVLLSPAFLDGLSDTEAVFVLAHELMHLCLDTASRAEGDDLELFNIAHDLIINDMLLVDLGLESSEEPGAEVVLGGGLWFDRAREWSLERLVHALRSDKQAAQEALRQLEQRCRNSLGPSRLDAAGLAKRREESVTSLGEALRRAGLVPGPEADAGEEASGPGASLRDFLPPSGHIAARELGRDWVPDTSCEELTAMARELSGEAARALALGQVRRKIDGQGGQRARGGSPGVDDAIVGALRTFYRPPWELALQRWFDSVAPPQRTYSRASRRVADQTDVVLPGRDRRGWTLQVILDTSGSMTDELARSLGIIARFCEASGVSEVRLLQCDAVVTSDEWVTPEELGQYVVRGFGGSGMSPAMLRLAEDPEVEAAVVLTDGFIVYPTAAMPYGVLWALTEGNRRFAPPYGAVVTLDDTGRLEEASDTGNNDQASDGAEAVLSSLSPPEAEPGDGAEGDDHPELGDAELLDDSDLGLDDPSAPEGPQEDEP